MVSLHGTIRETIKQLAKKSVTPCEICEFAIERQNTIAKLNPFITLTHDTARDAAKLSTARYKSGQQVGPLDGIPVAIKDNFCTKDITTTCGSKLLQNYIPPYSANVVSRLEKAGAIIIGKTNMDEFGMGSGTIDSTAGPSTNIYRSGIKYKFLGEQRYPTDGSDDPYICGGSSGGSALSVASGSSFLAVGSDTGGSIRNPASYCGIVGLKPSYGVIGRWGLISLVNSMDVPGLFGRCADDVATMFGVLAAHDPLDSTSISSNIENVELPENPSLEGIVVGIPKEYHCPGLSKEVLDIWTKVADIMEQNGAQVREVSLPHTKYSIMCYSVLNPCEVASNFTRYTGVEYGNRQHTHNSMSAMYANTRHSGLSQVVRSRILAGNYFLLRENRDKYLNQALKVRRLINNDFKKVWSSGVQLLLTPVTLSAAIKYSEFKKTDNRSQMEVQDFCTQPANMAGIPAVSVPIELNNEGMPLSLQIMGCWGNDMELLKAAKWLEQKVNFPRLLVHT